MKTFLLYNLIIDRTQRKQHLIFELAFKTAKSQFYDTSSSEYYLDKSIKALKNENLVVNFKSQSTA